MNHYFVDENNTRIINVFHKWVVFGNPSLRTTVARPLTRSFSIILFTYIEERENSE